MLLDLKARQSAVLMKFKSITRKHNGLEKKVASVISKTIKIEKRVTH